jgi:hypothetical protein
MNNLQFPSNEGGRGGDLRGCIKIMFSFYGKISMFFCCTVRVSRSEIF